MNVYEAGAALPLADYKFVVNEDNVGDPQVDLPVEQRDPGKYPSLRPAPTHSPWLPRETRKTRTFRFRPAGT
ncbi:MAG: hypothetical protein ACYC0Q_07290 [Eubacteriales bacterium]